MSNMLKGRFALVTGGSRVLVASAVKRPLKAVELLGIKSREHECPLLDSVSQILEQKTSGILKFERDALFDEKG